MERFYLSSRLFGVVIIDNKLLWTDKMQYIENITKYRIVLSSQSGITQWYTFDIVWLFCIPTISCFLCVEVWVLQVWHIWCQWLIYRKELHDDVIKSQHFPRYWTFVRGIHRSPVNSPHKDQWRGALMFSLICLNRRLSKQWWGWWLETPSRQLWRHCNGKKYSLRSSDSRVEESSLRVWNMTVQIT